MDVSMHKDQAKVSVLLSEHVTFRFLYFMNSISFPSLLKDLDEFGIAYICV